MARYPRSRAATLLRQDEQPPPKLFQPGFPLLLKHNNSSTSGRSSPRISTDPPIPPDPPSLSCGIILDLPLHCCTPALAILGMLLLSSLM
ncbi:unnamed protein product [Arabis nemorensis]|uniref:Uncharacterized protein n=1 Tax=Arabis nemorensis TaxID=586526 RepID=A0A565BRN9_9BRAS|nr:unnamed protein product [Arabis nemorensis]